MTDNTHRIRLARQALYNLDRQEQLSEDMYQFLHNLMEVVDNLDSENENQEDRIAENSRKINNV